MKKQFVAVVSLVISAHAAADVAAGITALSDGHCKVAVKELSAPARAGNVKAQKALGDLYQYAARNCSDTPGDETQALSWYLMAAQQGDVEAQKELVFLYKLGKSPNPEQSVRWLLRAAAQGGGADLSALGTVYANGEGLTRDRTLAYAMMTLSLQRSDWLGRHDTENYLPIFSEKLSPDQIAEGKSLAANWKQGTALPTTSQSGRRSPIDWYLRLAEAGDLAAALKLGMLYGDYDSGRDTDPERAAYWLRKAAQGGSAEAQSHLSSAYAHGDGVTEDFVLAYLSLALAARGGAANAVSGVAEWEAALTDQQLAEAKSMLAQWKVGTPLPVTSQYGAQRKVHYVRNATGKAPPTDEVRKLFAAASEGDEATFTRLIATVTNLNDYVVDNCKLLHALLKPALSLRADETAWRREHDSAFELAHWQRQRAKHLALLPAKTRMLALALNHGASFDEGCSNSDAAALHLASMFGSPEMVRMLLAKGADPRQYGGSNGVYAPLEYALQQREHGLQFPEMIDPEQRSEIMLALLKAGAQRPYLLLDQRSAREAKAKGEAAPDRPSADYLVWNTLLGLTTGTAVLDALAATGTTPYSGDDGVSPLAYAARAGNADAIGWLKTRVPRFDEAGRDRWVDAAMLAMYNSKESSDQVLRQLLVPDLHWAQTGPLWESGQPDYRPVRSPVVQMSGDTLLGHAVWAHRLDWVAKLVALGAPVGGPNNQSALALALRSGDAAMVKLLLSLGADPLAGMESPLTQVLTAKEGDANMLPLLLEHIARVNKGSLSSIMPAALEEAVLSADTEQGARRVRVLVAAGFSAQGLSAQAVRSAIDSPDRELAGFLLEHGMLSLAAGQTRATADVVALLAAIDRKRIDLVRRMLELGFDLNTHFEDMPSPVELAITRSDTDMLAMLLDKGGRIDTGYRDKNGSGVLDRAVAANNVAILKLVTGNGQLRLNEVCLPATRMLAQTVLDTSDQYWALLRNQGLMAETTPCRGMVERLINYLSERRERPLRGWIAERLGQRLKQIGARETNLSAASWASLRQNESDDLMAVLETVGWRAPPAHTTAALAPLTKVVTGSDLALQKKLPGHYYLKGVTEVGSEIVLRADGRFNYSLAYGAADQMARGRWQVNHGQLVFRSDPAELPGAPLTPSLPTPTAVAQFGQLSIQVRARERNVAKVELTVLGDAPVLLRGRTDNTGWHTAHVGPVRQIVFYHPELNRGRPYVYEVPSGSIGENNFSFDLAAQPSVFSDFNLSMTVRDGALLWARDGREFTYEKAHKE
ncbi:MAG: SEL1-like repeat protein [Burkholderiales bacterium]|nr:SEL1-like repeat protein [Burkholderiales bacterium]